MIKKLRYFVSPGKNPYENLATEEELLMNVGEGEEILYLWQNERTVVIGRNQNVFKECRNEQLSNEEGFVARRLSGGGAVYHDSGNLNFTFLVRKEDYDVKKQTSVILDAVKELGIPAEMTGRNDLTVSGKKFSGNAYYETGDRCYHHGTIMLSVDTESMKRYLRPSAAKLKSKGVDSVEARVVNLCTLKPDLTVPLLEEALIRSFGKIYGGLVPQELFIENMDIASLLSRRTRFGSVDWVYGKVTEFKDRLGFRGPYGEVDASLLTDRGVIREAKVYSDSMDVTLPERLEKELTGLFYDSPEMEAVLRKYGRPEDKENG